MFFASIALRYAFPISVYAGEGCVSADGGRSVTMQSISSSLKVRPHTAGSLGLVIEHSALETEIVGSNLGHGKVVFLGFILGQGLEII